MESARRATLPEMIAAIPFKMLNAKRTENYMLGRVTTLPECCELDMRLNKERTIKLVRDTLSYVAERMDRYAWPSILHSLMGGCPQ